MTPTMTSDTVTTHLDANSTMTPDPIAISLRTTPTTTPATVTTLPDKASFASLPREIRDEIYRLALPDSCDMRLIFNRRTRPSSRFRILSPQASTSTYANEACAILFQRNSFGIWVEDLKLLLGEDGISCVFDIVTLNYKNVHVLPKGCFDVKPWLRDIVIDITMEDETDKLAASMGLLLECPALRSVKLVLYGGHSTLKRTITIISSAFETLAEQLGRRLVFSLAIPGEKFYTKPSYYENFIGNLEKLERVARNEPSNSQDDLIRVLKKMGNE